MFDVEMAEQQPSPVTTCSEVEEVAAKDFNVSDGSKVQESLWLGQKGKAAKTQKSSINRMSKRIEKPPKKVPIKKLQLEEKKLARKQKQETAAKGPSA